MRKYLAMMALGMAALASDYPYRRKAYNPTPVSKEPTEEQRRLFREHKTLTEFTIQGHKIMAYSKKDAITRLTHQGLIKKKKKR